uniref:CCHC-type domain-containing protein n=1 Tax=Tanacetum cinerariifolium TaxID=118510 RepID=A0A6L2JX22_TANCI|nr:hypothetical protein [Tanacetum cinerariifolium]
MEDEFYNVAVKGNDLKTYIRRFQELAILCPNMEAITITHRLMEQVIKHNSAQETNDHKLKFEDRRNTTDNNNNYPNDHNNNNHSNNRNNDNYQNNHSNHNRNNDYHHQQNRRQENIKTYAATPTENKSAPILSLPEGSEDFVVYCDASPSCDGDEDVDTDAPWDTQPPELRGSPRDSQIMPPKRRSQTNPQSTLTQEAVDQLVRDGIKEAIRDEQERVRMKATRAGDETTFEISECVEGKKVKFSTATLYGRALTWWNSQVTTLGREVANGRPWTNVKQMMTDEFCPSRKFRAHVLMEQKIQAKNERIAEGLKRKWENNNQGNNKNNNNHNRGNYRNNNHHNQNNNRRQNNARALTMAQNARANQTRIALKCNHCGRGHFDQCSPKCENCRRMRHKAKDCRSKNVALGATVQPNVVCYECGERGHKSCVCPKKAD